jgi:hypothetical protein
MSKIIVAVIALSLFGCKDLTPKQIAWAAAGVIAVGVVTARELNNGNHHNSCPHNDCGHLVEIPN